ASRGLRPAARRRIAGGRRLLSGAGLPLRRRRLRAAISSRRDPRHDVPLDHARPRTHVVAERQAAGRAFRRSRGLRSRREGLARRVPQPLAGEAGGAAGAGIDGMMPVCRPATYDSKAILPKRRRRRAAQKCDELASLHAPTSCVGTMPFLLRYTILARELCPSLPKPMSADARLKELGLVLPTLPKPAAN